VTPQRPFLLAWSVAFAGLVFLERSSASIPAYHDGRLHFDVAWALREHPALPFVATLDTGHPPLVSFVLSLLWLVPVPRLITMHFLVWVAAALLVAAVFDVGRRAFGTGAGCFAAALLFFHPVFAAQALELNLDLFHAAFAWVAILGMVKGNARLATVGATAAALSKLNGLFTVAGLFLWICGRLAISCEVRPRQMLRALVPVVIPTGVFAVYHAIKLSIVGHLFATPEFQDDNLSFVHGLGAYGRRLAHAFDQIAGFDNPNLWVVRAIIVALVTVLVARATKQLRLTAWRIAPSPAQKDPGFYRPLAPASALAVVLVVAAVHVGLWSLRSYPSLVRYFLLVYPALYLTLAALVTLLPPRLATTALASLGFPLVALFALQARPTMVLRVFPEHARALLFPPSGVGTNYENSLELVDLMTVLRRTANDVERRTPAIDRVRAKWPFEAYLTDPRHGMVRTARRFSSDDPELVVETSSAHPGRGARDIDPPPGFELDHVERVGRVWIALFARTAPKSPGP
jgi:hypothetical protein